MQKLRAQGATEYLVLLAVVLIVALVSVALLGFFPGIASDTQITQSKAYWQSTSPIQIIESDARAYSSTGGYNSLYIRFRNSGSYQIRVTKLVADNNQSISEIYDGIGPYANMSDYYLMAPGEEKHISYTGGWAGLPNRAIYVRAAGICTSYSISFCTAQSLCQNSSSSPGTLSVSGFGFEYTEYIEGQQVTKRQAGLKPLLIKCGPPF
jgi:hypothetical protein